MDLIFSVTDALNISREAIEVPLAPKGEGSVTKLSNGKIQIIIPATKPLEDWLSQLKDSLMSLG